MFLQYSLILLVITFFIPKLYSILKNVLNALLEANSNKDLAKLEIPPETKAKASLLLNREKANHSKGNTDGIYEEITSSKIELWKEEKKNDQQQSHVKLPLTDDNRQTKSAARSRPDIHSQTKPKPQSKPEPQPQIKAQPEPNLNIDPKSANVKVSLQALAPLPEQQPDNVKLLELQFIVQKTLKELSKYTKKLEKESKKKEELVIKLGGNKDVLESNKKYFGYLTLKANPNIYLIYLGIRQKEKAGDFFCPEVLLDGVIENLGNKEMPKLKRNREKEERFKTINQWKNLIIGMNLVDENTIPSMIARISEIIKPLSGEFPDEIVLANKSIEDVLKSFDEVISGFSQNFKIDPIHSFEQIYSYSLLFCLLLTLDITQEYTLKEINEKDNVTWNPSDPAQKQCLREVVNKGFGAWGNYRNLFWQIFLLLVEMKHNILRSPIIVAFIDAAELMKNKDPQADERLKKIKAEVKTRLMKRQAVDIKTLNADLKIKELADIWGRVLEEELKK